MIKLILLFSCFILFACNNSSKESSGKDTVSKDNPKITIGNWTNEDEMEFIDGCVSNAENRLGKEKAFLYCKCVFTQVKANYASMDSATMVKLSDTTEIAKLAKNCD